MSFSTWRCCGRWAEKDTSRSLSGRDSLISPPPLDNVWAVHLSGGLLTGIFFLSAFWIWAWSSDSPHDTNLEVAAFTWGIGNLAYAPIELLGSSQAVGVMMFGVGFAAAAIVYFVKLSKWMASDYGGALADPAGAD